MTDHIFASNYTDPATVAAIVGSYHSAPFDVLGVHPLVGPDQPGRIVRAMLPQAKDASVRRGDALHPMTRVHPGGFFEAAFPNESTFFHYQLTITLDNNQEITIEDPYRFAPVLGEMDLFLFNEGNHTELYNKLGAQITTHEGVTGVAFALWAPNAIRVSVVGNFNQWDGRRHVMRPRGASGIWEIFIPGLQPGDVYKYEIKTPRGPVMLKADPYGFASEVRPNTASVVYDLSAYEWHDQAWLASRAEHQALDRPMSLYEVHLGSWKRKGESKEWLTYRELADQMIPYVKELGFTHVELLPVAEHPFDGSWGYQVTGYYAPTSRFGTPDDFRYFVDKAHQAGIGVIVDWVPAHFPRDLPGLGYFDGTHLYEHADPRQGEHKDWGTFIFNYGRNEVRGFLLNNALFWIDQYHIDGLRVDAVASMLYLDYSRKEGEWIPNQYGGRENLEAVAFLKHFNALVHQRFPGVLTFAEESTAWPMVSRPTHLGGLGFDLKWNMGWMHDSLKYISQDPIYRRYHHNHLTFSLLYAFTENFILPFSHDEVVHGKGSMMGKMPGDYWQKFANMRTLLGYMFTHPGKKLLFMGIELGQWREWSEATELDWALLGFDKHRQLQAFLKDMLKLYANEPALHQKDFSWEGFQWVDFSDSDNSIVSFLRRGHEENELMMVVANFTPVPRINYRVGLPTYDFYKEVLNSDSALYGGSNMGNGGGIMAETTPWQSQPFSAPITVPPLAVMCFKPERPARAKTLATPQPAPIVPRSDNLDDTWA